MLTTISLLLGVVVIVVGRLVAVGSATASTDPISYDPNA